MPKTETTKGKSLKDKAIKVHKSVMISEVLKAFGVSSPAGGARLNNQVRIIDATLGAGGHTLELIKNGVNVLGIELDREILKIAETRLKEACPPPHQNLVWGSYTLVQGNFKDIGSIAKKYNFTGIEGILFDLGVSNIQLTSESRGFSFSNPEAPLDMRINALGPSAADFLNILRKDQLEDLFFKVLKKGETRELVRQILKFRSFRKFERVGDFLEVCGKVLKRRKFHPATRAFLALRMAVNSELENLQEALPSAFDILKPGGKLAVISFHSTEDRLVKDFFKSKINFRQGRLTSVEPIIPRQIEIENNPHARSAKMRILEKI